MIYHYTVILGLIHLIVRIALLNKASLHLLIRLCLKLVNKNKFRRWYDERHAASSGKEISSVFKSLTKGGRGKLPPLDLEKTSWTVVTLGLLLLYLLDQMAQNPLVDRIFQSVRSTIAILLANETTVIELIESTQEEIETLQMIEEPTEAQLLDLDQNVLFLKYLQIELKEMQGNRKDEIELIQAVLQLTSNR